MNISRLDWDSDFFGYEVGKLNISKEESSNLDDIKGIESYKLVYLFSEEKIKPNPKFFLSDTKVTLRISNFKKIIEKDYLGLDFVSFDSSIPLPELESLVLEAGVYSRFKIDPTFSNNEFEKLYVKWLHNSIKSDTSEVLLVMDSGVIAGFIIVSFSDDSSMNIGLIAVADSHKGKGVASLMMTKAINLAKEKECSYIDVVTQLDNKPALGLYRKYGFEIINTSYIYHIWNL